MATAPPATKPLARADPSTRIRTMIVSAVKALGIQNVVEDSSGNAAASLEAVEFTGLISAKVQRGISA